MYTKHVASLAFCRDVFINDLISGTAFGDFFLVASSASCK